MDMRARARTHKQRKGNGAHKLFLQVKLAQMVSMNEIFPAEITSVFKQCCDRAWTRPLEELIPIILAKLKCPLGEVFSFIECNPLGSASIAQVHKAKLVRRDAEVIIKIQHPGVAESMRADVAIIPMLIELVSYLDPQHGR